MVFCLRYIGTLDRGWVPKLRGWGGCDLIVIDTPQVKSLKLLL